jgi:hypothetical protein
LAIASLVPVGQHQIIDNAGAHHQNVKNARPPAHVTNKRPPTKERKREEFNEAQ